MTCLGRSSRSTACCTGAFSIEPEPSRGQRAMPPIPRVFGAASSQLKLFGEPG